MLVRRYAAKPIAAILAGKYQHRWMALRDANQHFSPSVW